MWKRIPEQIRHLVVPIVALVVIYFVARLFLIPPTFGLWGHYRAQSVIQNAELPLRYAGSEACADCHSDVVSLKQTGYHRGVACETCHSAAFTHTQDPEKLKPQIVRARTLCLRCHEYLSSRPTGFPQVVSDSHNPLKLCIACHQPHDPKPPHVPKGCDACHATIQRTLDLSPHGNLKCTVCHEAPKNHEVSPRGYPAKIPQVREVCGKCHAQDSPASKDIPRVDMATHGGKYFCWDCHYPHMPEAR
jgi:predicted CXXCH cytochrome family protein